MPDTRPSWIVRIPPPIWALAMLIIAYVIQRSFAWGSVVYFRSLPLAVLFFAAGIALSAWGQSTFMAAGTEIMPSSPTNKKLVTNGPFRLTRNPMYSGLTLTTLGNAIYFGTIPFFLVPLLLFVLCNGVFVPFEEAKMQRQFDDQYTDYLRRVRRWV